MNNKQLPPLPTPKLTETIRGVPCITVTEHEHLMREYALQAITHATQPAEVTDEQIESYALEAGFSVKPTGSIWAVDGYVGTRVDPGLRKFARAILALRPVQVPMTDEQLRDCLRTCQHDTVENLRVRWLYAKEFARAVEAHHGITAQDKKEQA